MVGPYKRRKSAGLIRTFWVYRRLIGAAIVLGILLWFVLYNNQQVTIYFPFGLGQPTSSIGIVILLSAATGSLITALVTTIVLAWRHYRIVKADEENEPPQDLPDERPPSDYASKTTEGFSDAPWSAR